MQVALLSYLPQFLIFQFLLFFFQLMLFLKSKSYDTLKHLKPKTTPVLSNITIFGWLGRLWNRWKCRLETLTLKWRLQLSVTV